MMLAPGSRKTMTRYRRLAVGQAARPDVLDRVGHRRHVRQPQRAAVPVADDERLVLAGLEQLIRGRQRRRPAVVRQLALRPVGIRRREEGADVFEAETVAVQRGGVDVDPHRRQRAAADEHLADAVDLRDLLLQDRGREVVHPALLDHVRRQRQHHDRRVGRIDFAIARVVRAGSPAAGRAPR